MSIKTEYDRIKAAKEAIRQAIADKGQAAPTNLKIESFPPLIRNISTTDMWVFGEPVDFAFCWGYDELVLVNQTATDFTYAGLLDFYNYMGVNPEIAMSNSTQICGTIAFRRSDNSVVTAELTPDGRCVFRNLSVAPTQTMVGEWLYFPSQKTFAIGGNIQMTDLVNQAPCAVALLVGNF